MEINMKFRKIVIDGKEYYERIDDSTAAPELTGEIIDCEVEDASCDAKDSASGSEKFKEDAKEFIEKLNSGAKDLGEKITAGAKDIGEKISAGAKDLGEKIVRGTKDITHRVKVESERLFRKKDQTRDPNSKEARLLRLLPYMSHKEIHELCEKILADDETLKSIDISTILPFLSQDDCDTIFKKCINLGKVDESVYAYVSKKCLSEIVDGYIQGNHPSLDIDALYPFLADADIKRIFYHILNSEE